MNVKTQAASLDLAFWLTFSSARDLKTQDMGVEGVKAQPSCQRRVCNVRGLRQANGDARRLPCEFSVV